MARKTKNPPSETDVLLTNYIDQTLGNTGKIGYIRQHRQNWLEFRRSKRHGSRSYETFS